MNKKHLFKLIEYYKRIDGVEVEIYKPLEPLYIKSFDIKTQKVVDAPVLKLTVHRNLSMFKVIDKNNPDKLFWVSSDHSMLVYNSKNSEFKRVSPLYLNSIKNGDCECYKKIYENLCFIKVYDDNSFEYVPVDNYEIIRDPDKNYAYDFTVEGTLVFVEENSGLVIYDTMAIYPILSKNSQEELVDILDPKLQLHPGKFRIISMDNELVSALYWLTKNTVEYLQKKGKKVQEYETINDFLKDYAKVSKLERETLIHIKNMNWLTTSGRAFVTALTRVKIDKPLTKPAVNTLLTKLYVKYVLIENQPERYKSIVNLLFKAAAKIANVFSISLYDLYDEEVFNKIKTVKDKYRSGLIDDNELQKEFEKLADYASKKLPRFEISFKSKTKLHKTLPQMIIARGKVRDMQGRVTKPILESYFEGLSDESIFLSSYGSRRGLLDKTQNVADSGYLLRKLIFAVQTQKELFIKDLNNRTDFCGTEKMLEFELDEIYNQLESRFLYRTAVIEIPDENRVIERILDHDVIGVLEKYLNRNVKIKIYSPLYCKSKEFCRKCLPDIYLKISNGYIGMLSAQALCEDLTQSLMRTFHTGGSANETHHLPESFFKVENKTALVKCHVKVLNVTDDDKTVVFENLETGETFSIELSDTQIVPLIEFTKDQIIEPDTEIFELKSVKDKDYKQLTKIVDYYFKTKNPVTVDEFYKVLEPVNCQSLYKEVLIQMCYKHQLTDEPGRLHDYKASVKIDFEDLPHEGIVTSLAFGNPNKFFGKMLEVEESVKYLIEEESRVSPIVALCINDFENLG